MQLDMSQSTPVLGAAHALHQLNQLLHQLTSDLWSSQAAHIAYEAQARLVQVVFRVGL